MKLKRIKRRIVSRIVSRIISMLLAAVLLTSAMTGSVSSSSLYSRIEMLTKPVIVEGMCYIELREIYGPYIERRIAVLNGELCGLCGEEVEEIAECWCGKATPIKPKEIPKIIVRPN